MNMRELWAAFKENYYYDSASGLGVDISRIGLPKSLFKDLKVSKSLRLMEELVAGALANPDEKRMVGHYWLRNSGLAPKKDNIAPEIDGTLERIKRLAADVHAGTVAPATGKKFKYLLVIGIGGSALGPQFVSQALGKVKDPIKPYFFDNTDSDGMSRILETIPALDETLVLVISKSGGTPETRNGQIIAKHAFTKRGLSVSRHFIAITGVDSALDRTAQSEGWLARFPMWDWVGGRTSEFSAVGLLPAALQGIGISAMLAGAKAADVLTSESNAENNPAMLLALSWYHVGSGRGLKDMVVLPYKDRLELFSRYLQQLVMESLGKEFDLDGNKVNQGIAVYGNKGSTDQHAYVQQLRDGINNFFVIFIEVLKDSVDTDPDISNLQLEGGDIRAGDYLGGFLLGTRQALYDKDRTSVTITIPEVSPFTVGVLVALFERAVGFYASLINVNAYHQPGVEAGKKAAAAVLELQKSALAYLSSSKLALNADEVAEALGTPDSAEAIFKILSRLAANRRVKMIAPNKLVDAKFSV